MQTEKMNVKRIIILAGSFISFAIGSGFATGQEAMQFFGAYGMACVFVLLSFIILNIYIDMNYLNAGRKGNYEKGTQVYQFFCGKYIGAIFDWFSVFFCFVLFVVMVSGAGATLQQQWGLPVQIGGVILAATACGTVLLGLQKMVNVLGVVGPVVIILALIASFFGIINGQTSVFEGAEKVVEMDVLSAGDSWVNGAITYNGFGMLMFGGFIATIGKTEKSMKTARLGISIGIIAVAISIGFVVCGLLCNIELVAGSQIPVLVMINSMSPVLATVYCAVIFLAIFSTASPLLWTVCDRLATPGTNRYSIVCIALTVAGTVIALSLPFDRLVNTMFTLNGYAGFVLIAFLIGRNIYDLRKRKTGETP